MRTIVWQTLIASGLSFGMFGCAISNDTANFDRDRPAVSASTIESAQDLSCGLWVCTAANADNTCESVAGSALRLRCRSNAVNNCNAECGGPCHLTSETCDSVGRGS